MDDRRFSERTSQVERRMPPFVRAALAIVLTLVAAVMLVILVLDLRQGNGTPMVNSGIIDATQAAANTQPATEPPTEPPTEAATEPPLSPAEQAVQTQLAAMSTHEKICQLFFVTPDDLTGQNATQRADDTLKDALSRYPVGGVLLLSENLFAPTQTTDLIAGMQEASAIPLLVGVSEEGGVAAPLSAAGITRFYDSMAVYGAEGAVDRVGEIGGEMAEDLQTVGIQVNFAPVADVLVNPNNYEIGVRSFGSDPLTVATMVRAMVRGLQDGGCIACLTHFPGLAGTETDSRYGVAVSQRTRDELAETELVPFSAGIDAGAQMVMVSHLALPNVSGDNTPAALSETIVSDMLRTELAFDGVVITDRLTKPAVTEQYPVGDAVVAAVNAGCDMLLTPADLPAAVEALTRALATGTLTESRLNESVSRILLLKYNNNLLNAE